jgi:rhamnosyltransferase subunit B
MGLRLVIATLGSLGDLHPFVAVARALKARGHDPVMAVPEDHLAKCRAAGLTAVRAFPSYRELLAAQGLDEAQSIRAVMQSSDYLIRRILLPALAESTAAIHAQAEGADGVIVSPFALGGVIAAEARGLPLINGVLQPMSLMSACEPPRTPDFRMMIAAPRGRAGRAWNRAMLEVIGLELRRRYSPVINAVRRSWGLAPMRAAPLFAHEVPPRLTLALYARSFAPAPPDAPPNTQVVGFPRFDSDSGGPEFLSPDLKAFLARGEAPLVFTLGSFAVHAPGDFYGRSLKAARLLNRRSVLLIGPEGASPGDLGDDVHVAAYAPHSLLFPGAAAIVHHGGVGTTGQALHAGRPQLITPHMGDQPDNAARVSDLGVGATLSAARYRPERVARLLHRLLMDPDTLRRAEALADRLSGENGAVAAAAAIEAALP